VLEELDETAGLLVLDGVNGATTLETTPPTTLPITLPRLGSAALVELDDG